MFKISLINDRVSINLDMWLPKTEIVIFAKFALPALIHSYKITILIYKFINFCAEFPYFKVVILPVLLVGNWKGSTFISISICFHEIQCI